MAGCPASRPRRPAGGGRSRSPLPAPGAWRRHAVLLLGLCGCVLRHGSLPVPEAPPHEAAMAAVLPRVRSHSPREARRLPLAIAPVTLNYEAERYRFHLRSEFEEASRDLASKGGRIDPIGALSVGGVPVRRTGDYDPYDVTVPLLVRFTPVGFSPDSTRAVLVVVTDCGTGCGSAAGVGLRRRDDGRWRVAEVQPIELPQPAR